MEYGEARLISAIADALKRGRPGRGVTLDNGTAHRRRDFGGTPHPRNHRRHCPACGPASGAKFLK